MTENMIKGVITLALAGVSAYFHELLIPSIILMIVVMLDYITGMVSAWYRRELSSRAGFRGVIKKACYFVAVIIGIILDWVVRVGLSQTGIDVGKNFTLFGLIVIIWLVINELLSLCENLDEMNVPLPPFMKPIIKRIKSTVEKKVKVEGDGE